MSESEDKKGFSFVKETIKERPINKRRVIIRILFTIFLAIIFGLVAGATYIICVRTVETAMSSQPIEEVHLSDEIDEEQLSEIEEVIFDDSELYEDESSGVVSDNLIPEDEPSEEPEAEVESKPAQPVVVNNIVEKVNLGIDDYASLYSELYRVASDASSSLVSVAGVASETDWFSNTYESRESGMGLIIANNRRELMILINREIIEDSEGIRVILPNGTEIEATEKKYDPCTNLAIIAIPIAQIDEEVMGQLSVARLGTSTGSVTLGKNIIAIGAPVGITNSISYGMVTCSSELIQLTDTDVHLLRTNMYGSQAASGALINLHGEVVGIITDDYVDPDAENILTAYGISDLKKSIERMSNGQDKAYLGIYGTDVTTQAFEEQGVPRGAYVTEVALDSPAMNVGIQSGDVVTRLGDNVITIFSDYKAAMNTIKAGEDTTITVSRFGRTGYSEMTFDVTMGVLE